MAIKGRTMTVRSSLTIWQGAASLGPGNPPRPHTRVVTKSVRRQALPVHVFTAPRSGYEPTLCVGAAIFILLTTIGDLPKLTGRHRPLEA